VLENIDTKQGEITLDAGVLHLPTDIIKMTNQTELTGRRVAVLRTDDPDHPYMIREVKT